MAIDFAKRTGVTAPTTPGVNVWKNTTKKPSVEYKSSPDYMKLVKGDKPDLGKGDLTPAVEYNPETYDFDTTVKADKYDFSDMATFAVRGDDDVLGSGGDKVQTAAQEALLRFLENPTEYKPVTDEAGRTAYDLARERVSQEAQTQRDENIEELRGNLAAQGITGPAAEKMIADMMVQSDIQEAKAIGELTTQELAAIDQFARDAQLQAASTFGDIYGQEKDIEARGEIVGAQLTSAEKTELANLKTKAATAGAELTSSEKTRLAELDAKLDIAEAQLTSDEKKTLADLKLKAATVGKQLTSEERQTLAGLLSKERIAATGMISDEILTRLKGDIQKDIQTTTMEYEANIKAKLDRGYRAGAADRLEGQRKKESDLRAAGYDTNQINAYNAGFDGMAVEEFQAKRDTMAQLTLLSVLSPGAITAGGIDDIMNTLYGGTEREPMPTDEEIRDRLGLEPGEPIPSDELVAGVYDTSSGKIMKGDKPVTYQELTTMFRDAGAYGEPTTEMYENLKDTAPALNLSIGDIKGNEFTTMPTAGQVYVVNGRPMVVAETAERVGRDYEITDYDGNVSKPDNVAGRESDAFALLDLKTGEQETFLATRKDKGRGKSIKNLEDWASGLEG